MDDLEKLREEFKQRYFTWLVEVCAWLGLPKEAGGDLVTDSNWLAAFSDGYNPLFAVREFLTVIEELPQGKALIEKWPQLRERLRREV